MILSNVEVQKALKQKRLIIDPVPLPLRPESGKDCPYDTHTVDLTLGPEILEPGNGPYTVDFSQPGSVSEFISKNSSRIVLNAKTPYPLARGKFILGQTREVVGLPIPSKGGKCLAARIEGKSSRARFGLLVRFTAPTVHPGFDGTLTLEIINLGPADILLRPGIAIAQLIVEEVKGIPFENKSQFFGQRKPEGKS